MVAILLLVEGAIIAPIEEVLIEGEIPAHGGESPVRRTKTAKIKPLFLLEGSSEEGIRNLKEEEVSLIKKIRLNGREEHHGRLLNLSKSKNQVYRSH